MAERALERKAAGGQADLVVGCPSIGSIHACQRSLITITSGEGKQTSSGTVVTRTNVLRDDDGSYLAPEPHAEEIVEQYR